MESEITDAAALEAHILCQEKFQMDKKIWTDNESIQPKKRKTGCTLNDLGVWLPFSAMSTKTKCVKIYW